MTQRGNVYFISVDDRKVCGCEQKGYRPGIIVSNNFANKNSPVVTVVFLTSKPKKSLPIHVEITSVPDLKNSIALCEQICCVSKDRIHRLGLPEDQYTQYYYHQLSYQTEDGAWSLDEAVYQRLMEKEQIMLDAIDNHVLEAMPTSDEDLDKIFERLF